MIKDKKSIIKKWGLNLISKKMDDEIERNSNTMNYLKLNK